MKIHFISFLLILASLTAKAGLDPPMSLYQYNRFWYNPAFAGAEGKHTITFANKNQWIGMPNKNPQAFTLSYDQLSEKLHGGIGGTFLKDRIGATDLLQFGLSYSYSISLSEKTFLRFGMSGSLIHASIDFRTEHSPYVDPNTIQKKVSKLLPDADAGLWFNAGNFFLGYSARHLLQPTFKTEGYTSTLASTNHYLTSGMKFKINDTYSVVPSIISRGTNIFSVVDFNSTFHYKEMLSLGASYRSNANVFVINGGINILKKVQLAASYDAYLNGSKHRSFDAVLRITI